MVGSANELLEGSATDDVQMKSTYHRQGWKVPQIAPWIGGLICCICANCTDESALQQKLIEGQYLSRDEYSAADHRATQISIWGNLIGILLLQRHPRFMGCIGGLLVLGASLIFVTLRVNSANQTLVMIALGLLQLGGTFAFSSSLSFSNLVPTRQGLLDGINGGMTNSAGLVFLPFIDSYRISLPACFVFVSALAILCIFTALITFPDDAYDRGDQAEFRWPSVHVRRRRPSQARQGLKDQLRMFSDARLIGFMLSSAWCSTALDWRQGSKASAYGGHAPPGFFKWGWSISSNMDLLSSLIVGFLIDLTVPRWGYCVVGFLMLSSTALMLAALLTYNHIFQWLSLLPNPLNVSLIWVTYYNYIQRCYQVEVMPFLLAVWQVLSGVLGFLNSFAFPTNPWGNDFRPLVLFFAAPLAPLCFWPLLERMRVDQQRVGGRCAETESQASSDGTGQVP